MRTRSEVLQEINQVQIIRGALNHFLASHQATQMPECEAAALENKKSVSATLTGLYEELSKIKPNTGFAPKTERIKHVPTPEFLEGIKHFNKDRRFTITE